MRTQPTPGYLDLKALSLYSGLSVRTLRKRLNDPINPLPHYKDGKILVKLSDYEDWIAVKRTVGRPSLTKALEEMGLVNTT